MDQTFSGHNTEILDCEVLSNSNKIDIEFMRGMLVPYVLMMEMNDKLISISYNCNSILDNLYLYHLKA